MNKFALLVRMFLIVGLALCTFYGIAPAQTDPEDLKHYEVDTNLIVSFLERYGYKKYQRIEEGVNKIITFRVQDQKLGESIDFFITLIPRGNMMKIEVRGVNVEPLDARKYNRLLDKTNELNSTRTIGKFCLEKDRKTLRYFYYKTFVGGLCYADFIKTLEMYMFIAFNDLKELKALAK